VEPPLVPELLPEPELAEPEAPLEPELVLEPELPPEPEAVPESSPVELPFEVSEDEHELAIAPAVMATAGKRRKRAMGDVLGKRASQGPRP
jgi:hypothetical protein